MTVSLDVTLNVLNALWSMQFRKIINDIVIKLNCVHCPMSAVRTQIHEFISPSQANSEKKKTFILFAFADLFVNLVITVHSFVYFCMIHFIKYIACNRYVCVCLHENRKREFDSVCIDMAHIQPKSGQARTGKF